MYGDTNVMSMIFYMMWSLINERTATKRSPVPGDAWVPAFAGMTSGSGSGHAPQCAAPEMRKASLEGMSEAFGLFAEANDR